MANTKTIRVTYWAGTTQCETEVSSYKAALKVVSRYHRNSFDPVYTEISTGRRLVDDGTGLCTEDRSYYAA